MRPYVAAIVLASTLTLLPACAATREVPALEPVASSVALSEFRCIWVAGFVTEAHNEVDVNDAAVQGLREALRASTSMHVVEARPLEIRHETDIRKDERFGVIAQTHGTPLVVTGSIRFEHPTTPRAASRLRRGRTSSTHVSLHVSLVFIDGGTGTIIATRQLPSQDVQVRDDRTALGLVFKRLFRGVTREFLRAVAGSGEPRSEFPGTTRSHLPWPESPDPS